jgi:ribosomal protein L37AE/L43A
MTGKNKKELQVENSQLKVELKKWKIDFGKLSETRIPFCSNWDKTLKNITPL